MAEPLGGHFSRRHSTNEYEGKSHFLCNVCGQPGLGLKHRCPTCNFNLHSYCQKRPDHWSCCLHPNTQVDRHEADFMFRDETDLCVLCRKTINAGSYRFACRADPNLTLNVHLTCFLVEKKTTYPSNRVDSSGHQLQRNAGRGTYTCNTCKTDVSGLYLIAECRSDGDLLYHPFCVESSGWGLNHERTCFRHHTSDHRMAWTPAPDVGNRLDCALCQQQITGSHYLCGKKSTENRAIHPMCAQFLRNDRQFRQKLFFTRYVFNGTGSIKRLASAFRKAVLCSTNQHHPTSPNPADPCPCLQPI